MMNPPTGKVTRLKTNSWSKPLYQYPSRYDYKIAFGGRGSSKTYEVTQALTILGHIRPLRICIAREHLNSITESALPEMLDRMRNLGLMRPDCYEPTLTHIDHRNGTHVFFMGLSKMSEEDIKGLAQVDILWIEEAHTMSPTSWEKIRPTIRKDDSEIWASSTLSGARSPSGNSPVRQTPMCGPARSRGETTSSSRPATSGSGNGPSRTSLSGRDTSGKGNLTIWTASTT